MVVLFVCCLFVFVVCCVSICCRWMLVMVYCLVCVLERVMIVGMNVGKGNSYV